MECNLDDRWNIGCQGWIFVTDGPTVQSAHGKTMQVTRVSLAYVPDGDEWEPHRVRLVGVRLNADGNPGRRRDECEFTYLDDAPAWVEKLVEHYRPKSPPPEPPVPFCVLDTKE